MQQLTPSQLTTLANAFILARMPLLVTGAPGVGKSNIIEAIASQLGYDLLISHPVVSDPTDFKGLPFANGQSTEATFLPFGDLSIAINATRPLI
jgi:MoxR-like ATPase